MATKRKSEKKLPTIWTMHEKNSNIKKTSTNFKNIIRQKHMIPFYYDTYGLKV
jgi:hypothetical protein